VACSALPAIKRVIRIDADGSEHESDEQPEPDIKLLRERILAIVEQEGKTLSAVNAGLFAGRLADQVGKRITEVRRELAQKLVRNYCLAKGLAVAVNPIPVADLLSAAALDVTMVVHLSRLYGLPLSRTEAGRLVTTIVVQLAALMGAIWGVHLASAALSMFGLLFLIYGLRIPFSPLLRMETRPPARTGPGRKSWRYARRNRATSNRGALCFGQRNPELYSGRGEAPLLLLVHL
jgi:hypothetical protein